MRALFVHLSGFAGLLVFLNQLWTSAALERTLWTAFATGGGVYLVLLVAYVAVRHILRPEPSREAPAPPEMPDHPPKSQG